MDDEDGVGGQEHVEANLAEAYVGVAGVDETYKCSKTLHKIACHADLHYMAWRPHVLGSK